jgi:hypothetical protein
MRLREPFGGPVFVLPGRYAAARARCMVDAGPGNRKKRTGLVGTPADPAPLLGPGQAPGGCCWPVNSGDDRTSPASAGKSGGRPLSSDVDADRGAR